MYYRLLVKSSRVQILISFKHPVVDRCVYQVWLRRLANSFWSLCINKCTDRGIDHFVRRRSERWRCQVSHIKVHTHISTHVNSLYLNCSKGDGRPGFLFFLTVRDNGLSHCRFVRHLADTLDFILAAHPHTHRRPYP